MEVPGLRSVQAWNFFSHYDAGKLRFATETQVGCGTTSWRYAYDLMGNHTLKEKKNPGGEVPE